MNVNERPFSTIGLVLSTSGAVHFVLAAMWLAAALCLVTLCLSASCHWRPTR